MSFAREESVGATRKDHVCDGCHGPIVKGEPATRWSGLTDGSFASAIYHLDCRKAEIAWNEQLGTFHEDEWSSLEEVREEGCEDWLRAEFPAVAERMYGPVVKAEATHA